MELSKFEDPRVFEKVVVFKLRILGDSGIGKTSLLIRYADNEYSDYNISTIGVDFKIRTLEIDNSLIKISMWDTMGNERYNAITSTFYRDVHGVILAFDLTNMESFRNVKRWLDELDKFGGGDATKLLVGNKCDLEDKRIVTNERIRYGVLFTKREKFRRKFANEDLADRLEIPYVETSAKSATNVEQAFVTMATEMKEGFDTGAFQKNNPIILRMAKYTAGDLGNTGMCYC